MFLFSIHGDHSACSKPPVDIDLKVGLYYKDLILKRKFQVNVKERFWTSWMVTMYMWSVLKIRAWSRNFTRNDNELMIDLMIGPFFNICWFGAVLRPAQKEWHLPNATILHTISRWWWCSFSISIAWSFFLVYRAEIGKWYHLFRVAI